MIPDHRRLQTQRCVQRETTELEGGWLGQEGKHAWRLFQVRHLDFFTAGKEDSVWGQGLPGASKNEQGSTPHVSQDEALCRKDHKKQEQGRLRAPKGIECAGSDLALPLEMVSC